MNPDDSIVEHTWRARTMRPIVAVYVVGVFVGFMGMAHFVFHSEDAVRALFVAAIGAVAGMVPSVLNRVEYRITGFGLAKRSLRTKSPREFDDVFAWDELSHLVPTKTGFKFFKRLPDSGPVSRFFKLHFSAGHSGEFPVEPRDRARVRAIIDRKGLPASRAEQR